MKTAKELQSVGVLVQLVLFTCLCSVLFMTMLMWGDIRALMTIPYVSWEDRVLIAMSLYLKPLAYMSMGTFVLMCVAAFLTALNIILLGILRKTKGRLTKQMGGFKVPTLASALVVLGMGCAACGTVVLMSLFSWIGLAVGVTYASFIAPMFLIGGIGVLLYVNYRLYKQIQNPLVCY